MTGDIPTELYSWKLLTCLVFFVPRAESLEDLETIRGGRDSDGNLRPVLRWCLVGLITWIVTSRRQAVTSRWLEHELLPVFVGELVSKWVEVEGSSHGHGNNEIGRSDEGVCCGVGARRYVSQMISSDRISGSSLLVAAGKVAVIGRNDAVCLSFLLETSLSVYTNRVHPEAITYNILAIPLTWKHVSCCAARHPQRGSTRLYKARKRLPGPSRQSWRALLTGHPFRWLHESVLSRE